MMLVSKPKQGFTLMELMIALGLLGALMAVAWSLLGTFRDAEMRGWKLSHRTQTIRSARAWLESDLQHLVLVAAHQQPVSSARSNLTIQASSAVFHGNSMGFSATISPSIDPIPFLGNLMSEGDDVGPVVSPDELAMVGELGDVATPGSLWPADSVEVEYQLVPMTSKPSAQSTASSRGLDGMLGQTPYSLVRREQLDASTDSTLTTPSERVLNVQDLYRQQDAESFTNAKRSRETRLEGLMHPQFRYFDGVAWVSQWNSNQRGGLPRAIAFGFDFPAAADIQHPSEREASEKTENDSLEDAVLEHEQDTMAEVAGSEIQGLMTSSTNEVQLVIYVAVGGIPSAEASPQPISRMRP